MSSEKDDVEAGSNLLYPLMQENPEFRWAFIRKVYSILAIQLLVTFGFSALVVAVRPIAHFFNTWTGVSVYVILVLIPVVVVLVLYYNHQKHPLNLILLGIFTVCFGLAIGALCSFSSGKVILETVVSTAVVVISLTVYTFWAAKRGEEFGFLIPLLLSILVMLIPLTIFEIFYPMGTFSHLIYSVLCVIILSAYIIFDTEALIRRYSYDDYIWASIALYLDVLRIFLQLLEIFRDVDR